MDGTFVKELERLIQDSTLQEKEIDGVKYLSGEFRSVRPPIFHADTLKFNDLDSIVDMIKSEAGKYILPLYVCVESHNKVAVYTALDVEKGRENPYLAECRPCQFRFGQGYDYESFVIALRSLFVQNTDSIELLEIISKVKNSESVENNDDGVSQTVKASSGVALLENKAVNPIRCLRPFRTFPEVEQPSSEFLFRIVKDKGFYLFEADGGAWINDARKTIKTYFEDMLLDDIDNGKVIVVG
jgi:hypothetical protein